MKYLLDTNIAVWLYDPSSTYNECVKKQIQSRKQDSFFISVLTLFEMEYSLSNAPEHKKQQILNSIQSMKSTMVVLPLQDQSAHFFGKLKKALKDIRNIDPENMKKHNIDVMLASTAIVEKCVLVSHGDIYPVFKNFPEFKCEDWIL